MFLKSNAPYKHQSRVMVLIPREKWPGFKRRVRFTWFKGHPVLTRFTRNDDPRYEYARFLCDDTRDAHRLVSKMIPNGGIFMLDPNM